MSQLNNGLELMAGMGGTNANNLFDADMQRLDVLSREHIPFTMFGQAQASDIFGKMTFDYDVLIEAIEFNCFSGAPASGNLVVEIDGPGTSVTATLAPADGTYKRVGSAASPIVASNWLTTGTPLTIKFTSVDSAVQFPTIIVQIYKRKL